METFTITNLQARGLPFTYQLGGSSSISEDTQYWIEWKLQLEPKSHGGETVEQPV